MAVLAVTVEAKREGQVEARRNNLLYEVLARRYTLELNAYTSTSNDGNKVVLASPLVPQIGSTYFFRNDLDEVATCVRVMAMATANRKLWRVRAEYDTDRILDMITDNPLNQPPDINWDFADAERPMVRDYFGIPVNSSSGNPFDPPYMREEKRPILRIVRNEASYNPGIAYDYSMKLNKNSFAGAESLLARINSIPGHKQISNGIQYYQVSYEIEFRQESFVVPILDKDFRDIDGNLFRDPRTMEPFTNETPLNGRGRSIYKSVAKIQNNLTASAGDTTVKLLKTDRTKYPPTPKSPNSDGIVVGPHYWWNFRINDEIMTVTAIDTISSMTEDWYTVIRAQNSTSLVTATATTDDVFLEPYFLRFIPHGVKNFDDLALPVI